MRHKITLEDLAYPKKLGEIHSESMAQVYNTSRFEVYEGFIGDTIISPKTHYNLPEIRRLGWVRTVIYRPIFEDKGDVEIPRDG